MSLCSTREMAALHLPSLRTPLPLLGPARRAMLVGLTPGTLEAALRLRDPLILQAGRLLCSHCVCSGLYAPSQDLCIRLHQRSATLVSAYVLVLTGALLQLQSVASCAEGIIHVHSASSAYIWLATASQQMLNGSILALQAPSRALRTRRQAPAGAPATRTRYLRTQRGVTTASQAPRVLGRPLLSPPAASRAPDRAIGCARPSEYDDFLLLPCHRSQIWVHGQHEHADLAAI